MKKFFNSNKTVYIILCLVILAGICRFSYGFFVEKQGTHSDEEWSFGLANSYYEPYIYIHLMMIIMIKTVMNGFPVKCLKII